MENYLCLIKMAWHDHSNDSQLYYQLPACGQISVTVIHNFSFPVLPENSFNK